MKGRKKNLAITLGIIGIIFLSIFVVTTQYQLSELTKKDKENLLLFVKIFANETSVIIPHAIKFTSLVSNYEGEVDYYWNFGDGETSQDITTNHVYHEGGSFICNLTVIDITGKKASDSIEISATANQPPTVAFNISNVNSIRPYEIPFAILATGNYNDRPIDLIINFPLTPSSWLEKEGWIHCAAQVYDPEGDDIVSYKWKLQPPNYLFMGQTQSAEYIFEGEKITFPLLYTYRAGQYDVTLSVEDSEGNIASSVPVTFKVEQSEFETTSTFVVKTIIIEKIINIVYENNLDDKQKHMISDPLWKYVFGPAEDFLFNLLNKTFLSILPEKLGDTIENLYDILFGMLEQKFPRPVNSADLILSEIDEFDFSKTIELNGSVLSKKSISKSFMIINNDSSNTSRSAYITLRNPISGVEGLHNDIEKKELEVSIEVGGISKKIFYNEKYKKWEDCYLIENLAPGDMFFGDITITINKADEGTFKDDKNYSCILYIYQEKADHIDEIPFKILS